MIINRTTLLQKFRYQNPKLFR